MPSRCYDSNGVLDPTCFLRANSGIGRNAALKLAAQGHRVHLACRSLAKAEAAAQELQQEMETMSGKVRMERAG
jgi:NAD(P)-dependent dehydrogenase (short-subunit alcohol dehydrogenase family)